MPTPSEARGRACPALLPAAVLLVAVGCGGTHSERATGNARAFEALLSAVSLRNPGELERDARAIADRRESGHLSVANHRELVEIIERARAKDWEGAQRRAYEFRGRFGDEGAYFD